MLHTLGISNEIYTLANDPQVRPSTNIIISKNTAKDYLKNTKSPLENLITKNYQIFPNSSQYTGYIYDATLGNFIDMLVSHTSEPVAILGGINTSSEYEVENSTQVANIKSTNTSFSGENGVENIGVSVFRNDKIVGELTALDTLCFSIIQKKINSFLLQVPNTNNKNDTIDVSLYPSKKCKVKVNIINGAPLITLKCDLTGRIYSMRENSRYLSNEELKNISSLVSNYLQQIFTDFLYKTSLEFKSDINGFGKYCGKNFLTIKEFNDYDWKNNYQNSIFKVKINANIESGFLVTET